MHQQRRLGNGARRPVARVGGAALRADQLGPRCARVQRRSLLGAHGHVRRMKVRNLHSASEARRSTELHALAEQLYALISSGDDGLAFAVSVGGPALIERTADGAVLLKQLVYADGGAAWQRAKELHDGIERDRRFNAWVLEKHLRGSYSVAPAANGWVAWVCIDIDAHPRSGESELEARRRAKRMLGEVWRALGCSGTRHPLLLRSPGGG